MNKLKSLVYRLLPDTMIQVLRKWRWQRMFTNSIDVEPEQAVLNQFVKPGDSVIDIGANMGNYTRVMAALVGSTGNVYSIEPVPFTFGVLKNNIQHARLENVHLLQYAVSLENRETIMQIPHFDTGGESYYEAHITESPDQSLVQIKVQTKTLDTIHAEIGQPKIAFIKCDIEEHELECLKGAGKLISHSHPTRLIEIKGDPDDPNSRAYQTFTLLNQVGYKTYLLKGSQLQERQRGEMSLNYFFLPTL